MPRVTVVSAFVPLKVKHMSEDSYYKLGAKMFDAAKAGGATTFFAMNRKLSDCWSYELCRALPPATETPADRYETPEDHVNSHIVQHTRTQWAREALGVRDADIVVWLDLGILKQGNHTGQPVTEEAITEFVRRVARYEGNDIPFPGIEDRKPVLPYGNNWRFCGSTHIWPVKYLREIDRSYKAHLTNFVYEHKKVPLDLTIWPMVEAHSGLPFKWYGAEYDYTQLTNFPRPAPSPDAALPDREKV